MRPVSRDLFRVLNNENFLPVTLLDIRLIGSTAGSAIRITDAGTPVTFDGESYTPVNMTRGLHREVLGAEANQQPALSMTAQNIDLQMAALLNTAEVDGAIATIRLTDRRFTLDGRTLASTRRDVFVAAKGEVRNMQLTEQSMTFQVVNILGIMDRLAFPRRIFQPRCNYAFGSRPCTVDITAYPNTISFATQAGTTEDMIEMPAGTSAASGSEDPTDFWSNGYVIAQTGPAILQARPIHRITGDTVYLMYPFLTSPHSGTMLLRRGCPKTVGGCADRQADGTAKNFGGYADVPHGRIQPRHIYVGDVPDEEYPC
jgi:hypothetical protein